jgi:hypothetical protein
LSPTNYRDLFDLILDGAMARRSADPAALEEPARLIGMLRRALPPAEREALDQGLHLEHVELERREL